MAKAKKSKGFLSRAASLLGSIPAVGNVRNAAKKVGKAKKTLKKTVKKATKTAKRVVKSTKKNVKKSVKKKKKTAAKLKKGLKKAKKKAKWKVKKKLRKKVGKVFTKARKLKNNLSKNKRVKKLKKQMKKSVKKVKSTAKKVSKSVVQNSKKLSKKVALGARAVNEFVKNGFNGRETVSAIADFIPIVGNVKGAYEATFGKDPITGRKLGKAERAAAGAAVIGGPLVKGGTRSVKVVSGIVSGGKKSSGKVPVGKGTGKYQVGAYKDIKGIEGLDAHHVVQKAVMRNLSVKNFDQNTAPAINVPKVGHTKKGINGIVSRSTKGIESPRQLLARDIMELRRVYDDIPNSALKELIELNKKMYPEMRK